MARTHIRILFAYESLPEEYNFTAFARRRIYRYVDEQKCKSVPSGRLAVERDS